MFDRMTEEHAADAAGTDYGDERAVQLDGGGELRTAATGAAEYVRVSDRRGRELMYWHKDEFAENFPEVMGAVLGLACEVIQDNGRAVLNPPGDESEVLLPLARGGSIRFAAYPADVRFVRVCDDDGRELGRWGEEGFLSNFAVTLAAFFEAAQAEKGARA